MANIITNFNNKALELMKGNLITGFSVLFIWSFAESSFFPIPPDPVMWALVMVNPELWWLYALVTTIASVLGALFGYFIGDKAGRPILKRFVKGTEEEKEAKMDKVESLFREYENMAILIAALTYFRLASKYAPCASSAVLNVPKYILRPFTVIPASYLPRLIVTPVRPVEFFVLLVICASFF